MNILFNGELIQAKRISIDECMTFMSQRALSKYCDSNCELYITYGNFVYISLKGQVSVPTVSYVGGVEDINEYILSHTLK